MESFDVFWGLTLPYLYFLNLQAKEITMQEATPWCSFIYFPKK